MNKELQNQKLDSTNRHTNHVSGQQSRTSHLNNKDGHCELEVDDEVVNQLAEINVIAI